MLIQPADYDERVYTDPITRSKLEAIAKQFPTLLQSHIDAGILISKHPYLREHVQSHEALGDVLGFPCAKDYSTSHEESAYFMDILVQMTHESGLGRESILTMVCKDTTQFPFMENLAREAERVLRGNSLIGSIVERVVAVYRVRIPPSFLFEKIQANHRLTQDELAALQNIFWNMEFRALVDYAFEFDNPVHQGILLTLLSYSMHNLLEPLYPLHQWTDQYPEIRIRTEQWEHDIVQLLDNAKSKPKGGTRSTTKRNRNRNKNRTRRSTRSRKILSS